MDLLVNEATILNIFGELFAVIMWISAILILIMIFLERSDPKTIAMWTVILLFIPVIGFFIYLCFGQTFYQRRQFAIKNISDHELAYLKAEALEELNKGSVTPDDERGLHFARAMLEAGGSTYSNNNDLRLYTIGDPFFKDILNDLRGAKKFIHLEYYIIRNDKVTNEFMDILIDKAKNGVEVKLMVDAVGFNNGPKKRIKELRKAGGEFKLFHRAITVLLSPRKQNRNHRKLAVIDGTIGYVSGFNIGDEYLGKGSMGFWRDTGVRVEGNGAIPINTRFFMDWGYATKNQLDATDAEKIDRYFPIDKSTNYGNGIMQLISGGPDTKNNPIELQYLKLINTARKTLYIHTPYLVPSSEVQKALIISACSGVDVRIIMPDQPDHMFVFWVGILNAGELLENGVRIYQYKKGFVHSKTLVADSEFCSVGSANLDQRSMRLNFETNAMIYSNEIGNQMTAAFLEDLEYCEEYSIDDFRKLTIWDNFKISIARLFSPLA
ncbi:MAG: cardiolipin synthase [Candidatus Methanoplasma sp.]|jgi:cardiolipin synthase|nr:cardiolipin synthase [Candidatus Methanoplasma sp.]